MSLVCFSDSSSSALGGKRGSGSLSDLLGIMLLISGRVGCLLVQGSSATTWAGGHISGPGLQPECGCWLLTGGGRSEGV